MTTFPDCAAAFLAAALTLIALPAPAGDAEPDLAPGREIFTEGGGELPACAICHALEDAEATGDIGPDLDQLKPDEARVRVAVTEGVGVMPAFGEALTAKQIDAVARYVASAAGD